VSECRHRLRAAVCSTHGRRRGQRLPRPMQQRGCWAHGMTRVPCRHRGAAGKLAGLDKKLSRSLDQEVAQIAEQGSSPLELSRSPVGPLTDAGRCAASSRGGVRQAAAAVCPCSMVRAHTGMLPL
jgi:hypothetical protein